MHFFSPERLTGLPPCSTAKLLVFLLLAQKKCKMKGNIYLLFFWIPAKGKASFPWLAGLSHSFSEVPFPSTMQLLPTSSAELVAFLDSNEEGITFSLPLTHLPPPASCRYLHSMPTLMFFFQTPIKIFLELPSESVFKSFIKETKNPKGRSGFSSSVMSSALTIAHKQKCLWERLRAALICGYKHKYL